MNASDIPRKTPFVWASQAGGAYVNSVPDTGTSSDTGASFQQGFPPKTFQPVSSGGAPVSGADENGILAILSAWSRWVQAGGSVGFDANFVNQAGGYPKGAVIASGTIGQFWQSTADGNTGNPDSGAANWIPFPSKLSSGSNGYRVSSDGFIEQWGSVSTPAGGVAQVTFPIAFPNACFNVQATNAAGGPPTAWPGQGGISNSGFTLYSATAANTAPSQAGITHSWRAIGN